MAFIFLSPRFDKELAEAEEAEHTIPAKNLLAVRPHRTSALPSAMAKQQ